MPAQPDSFAAFRALSAKLGRDPLRVQGAGGNTSIKADGALWIKASGTELAEAEARDIFVAVDLAAARAEAHEQAGDGACKACVLDSGTTLRPSIETTFHAALDAPVVAHTHSIATLTHAISPAGIAAARAKLSDLDAAFIPYAKPGLPLTREILSRVTPRTRVIVLANHGLIICGEDVAATEALMDEVEQRLHMEAAPVETRAAATDAPEGYAWAEESWIAQDERAAARALAGSYYPDHVVFLGPALPEAHDAGAPPAILCKGEGVALRAGATQSQRAMLRCLSDVLARLPAEWAPTPIGPEAEAELLNWDAEKYRQALAKRS